MIKSELKNGEPILVVKVEHYVHAGAFATALTDHYYRNGEPFDAKLKRRAAIKILNRGLFFYGNKGEYDTNFFEASYELGEQRNAIYQPAYDWVVKNYPHLKPKELIK